MRITVFPHLQPLPGTRPNPYIRDMVEALAAQPGVSIANAPHRNPLLSLLRPGRVGDVVILNWFESIPDFRHGLIQTVIAVLWLGWLVEPWTQGQIGSSGYAFCRKEVVVECRLCAVCYGGVFTKTISLQKQNSRRFFCRCNFYRK